MKREIVVFKTYPNILTWRGIEIKLCLSENVFHSSGKYRFTPVLQKNANMILLLEEIKDSKRFYAIPMELCEEATPEYITSAISSNNFLYSENYEAYPTNFYPTLSKVFKANTVYFVKLTKLETL